MEQVAADPGDTRGEAMGAATQPQQAHRGGGAVAAAPELAAIAHQAEILREEPVAAADGGLAELQQPAGLHGGAAELQQIEQADVVQQLRQAVVMGLGQRRGARGSHGMDEALGAASAARAVFLQFSLRNSKAARQNPVRAGI